MSKKKTHEEYVAEVAVKNHNVEVIGTYVNAKTPILHKCKIDCYEWHAKPNNILSGKGCPKCGGTMKKTHKEYVDELSKKNSNVKVLGEYIDAKTPILHFCILHQVEWFASPSNVLYGKGCHVCCGEKIADKLRKNSNQYIVELEKANPNVILVGGYIDSHTPALHKCKVDGYEWYAKPSNVAYRTGCPMCAGNVKKTHEQYIEEIQFANSDIEVIEKYVDAKTPILHKCKIDGYIWSAVPDTVLHGCGCPQCAESSGERQVRQWLEKYNIVYEYQHPFKDCRDVLALPFDFYLPDFNMCIEYDGRQHFESIEYFGGQKSFEYVQRHDKIKNEYCEKNNIKLLRIPYFTNVEEELDNFLFI